MKTQNRRHWTNLFRFPVLGMALFFTLWIASGSLPAAAAATPLQQSGLAPVWLENFSNGSIDRMQYTWSKGDNSALTSFVMPGAVFLGKNGGTTQIEQEINNFKQSSSDPLASTIEFDVLSPNTGKGRVSLRPRRRGDMMTLLLGMPGDKTVVSFREDGVDIPWTEPTGPSLGWAHIVISYRQFDQSGTTFADMVVAINEEVKEHQAKSGIINPDYGTSWATDPNADGWSIEHNSTDTVMGKYIANVRSYSEFLTLAQLQSRLSEAVVDAYRASLPDPRNYTGPKKVFQAHKTLVTHGPNAMAYASLVNASTVRFDGSLSSDWDKITSYQWTFGDGATGSGRIVDHTFAQAGTYSVTLRVTSKAGADVHTISVSVGGGTGPTNTPTETAAPINTPTRTPTRAPTATATSAPPGSNLLVNPGFELDGNGDSTPDNWTAWTNFKRSNAVVHGGSFAGRFQATDNSSGRVNQRVLNLRAGTTYRLSGWVNIPATTDSFTLYVQVRWMDAAKNSISVSTVKTYKAATAGWDPAAGSLVAPAGTVMAEVRLSVTNLNATIYVDDLSFGP